MFGSAFSQPLKHFLVFVVLIQSASLTNCKSLSEEVRVFLNVLYLVNDVRPVISRF